MATSYNPKISTNGLVIYLDAANPNSYSGAGNTWRDLSGNGINGTLQGSPTYSTDNGGAIILNGSTQYITTTHSTNYTSAVTAACWIYIASAQVGANPMLVTKISANAITESDFPFRLSSNSTNVSAGIGTGLDFVGKNVNNTAHNSSGKWAHIAATFSQTALTLYVNGSQVGQTTYTSSTLSSNSQNWTFGRASQEVNQPSGFSCFTGRFGTIQLYNRTLSAAEIQQNFNALRGRYGV